MMPVRRSNARALERHDRCHHRAGGGRQDMGNSVLMKRGIDVHRVVHPRARGGRIAGVRGREHLWGSDGTGRRHWKVTRVDPIHPGERGSLDPYR